jgi:hypothetical protein
VKKLLTILVVITIIHTSVWCFADNKKIPIHIINNSNEAVGQELIKVLKNQIDNSSFARLAVNEPCKMEIIVTTKNKVAPKLPASLNILQAKRFAGITISNGNPYIGLADSDLTRQEWVELREKAAIWEAEHSRTEINSISYSIIWIKKDDDKSIYLDTVLGFCESRTINIITNDILTKTNSIINKSL